MDDPGIWSGDVHATNRCIGAPAGDWQATNSGFSRLDVMMIEAPLTSAHVASQGAFSVVAPFRGDVVAGALNAAYGGNDRMPEDLRVLLERLDLLD
jgi:hypothetical protein